MNRMPHPFRAMRLLLCFLMSVTALPLFAQTNDPAKVRRLSLEDCIEMALKHNLDLQIDRYNPEFQLYALRADYGVYDPVLSLSAEHDHLEKGNTLLSGGFSIAGSESDVNQFSGGLSGLLPWGMNYSIGSGSIQNAFGTSGTTVNNPNSPIFFSTNTLTFITNAT